MFYLSTWGDIGASLFRVVGLLQEDPHRMVGLASALKAYALRMLPGPFFPGRPGDFSLGLPERIGNGATHAVAEGFLISGWIGVALVASALGGLAGVSALAGRRCRVSCSLASFFIFAFPWLLLVRGGWYQFFSFFKAAEVLALLFLGLVMVRVFRLKRN